MNKLLSMELKRAAKSPILWLGVIAVIAINVYGILLNGYGFKIFITTFVITWLLLFILGVSALFICPYPGCFLFLTTSRLFTSCLIYSSILARTYSRSPQYGVPTRYHSIAGFISILVRTH